MSTRVLAEFVGTFWLVLFAGGWALAQLWVSRLAPLLGGILAGLLDRPVLQRQPAAPAMTGEPAAGGFGMGART